MAHLHQTLIEDQQLILDELGRIILLVLETHTFPHAVPFKRRVEYISIHQLSPGSGEEQNTSPNTSPNLRERSDHLITYMFTGDALKYFHTGQSCHISRSSSTSVLIQLFPFRLQFGPRLGRSLPLCT